jgi:hypothetical protein
MAQNNQQRLTEASMRVFESGARRNVDDNKLDYEAFLSPKVLERFAQYLHKHRFQADGQVRAGDNWQKGMTKAVYMKSLLRHVMDLWLHHRDAGGHEDLEEGLCAIIFNAQGYLFETLRAKGESNVKACLASQSELDDAKSEMAQSLGRGLAPQEWIRQHSGGYQVIGQRVAYVPTQMGNVQPRGPISYGNTYPGPYPWPYVSGPQHSFAATQAGAGQPPPDCACSFCKPERHI